MLRSFLLLSVTSLTCILSYAQQGKHGGLTANSTQIINEYTSLSQNVTATSTSIFVDDNGMNANGRFPGDLETGDLILIYQPQGASINTDVNSPTWGEITDYGGAGSFEYAEVNSINSDGSIELNCPLNNDYSTGGNTQIVRVPRYTNGLILAGGTITSTPWNGVTGGIVALEVSGDLTLDAGGVIDVSELGFRGGAIDNETGFAYEGYATNQPTGGAEKGESIAGYRDEYDAAGGRYGRGAPANGGGGGNNHNAGGGGGANGGVVANWSGIGVPNVATADMATAWDLESAGMSGQTSSGGGRGGYTWSGFNQDPLTTPPGDPSWGDSEFDGDRRRSVGGLGGRPLDNQGATMFYFGGGGGAGDGNNGMSNAGGAGGGIVFIQAYGNISGDGMILANGADGEDTPANGIDAPGGAGGGGTIVLAADGDVTGITVSAAGGDGGDQDIEPTDAVEAEGPGGGGGGGIVAYTNGAPDIETGGGRAGVTDQDIFSDFPQNGATGGANGLTERIDTWNFTIEDVTVCEGNAALLAPQTTGNPPTSITWQWFEEEEGGDPFAAGDEYTTPPITTRTTYYVEPCPYKPRQEVTVSVVSSSEFLPTLRACPGDSVTLSASPGKAEYLWNTGATASFVYGHPGTSYRITTTDDMGCVATAEATVQQYPVPELTIEPVAEICVNDPVLNVEAGPVAGGSWAGDGIRGTTPDRTEAIFDPSFYFPDGGIAELSYSAGSGGCRDTAYVSISITGLPSPEISSVGPFCPDDDGAIVSVLNEEGGTWSTESGSHLSSESSSSAVYSPIGFPVSGGTDEIQYTVGEGNCTVTATSPVIINGFPVIESVMPDPLCMGTDPIQLTATPDFGTWNGIGLTPGGLFNPAASGPGTFNVRYVADKEDCPIDTNMVITISQTSVTLPDDFTICQEYQTDFPYIAAEMDETYGTLDHFEWKRASLPEAIDLADQVYADRPDTYWVTGVNEHGCVDSTNVKVTNDCECILWIPNAFTPNADGINETFEIKGFFYGRFDLWIYDRWGDLKFHTTDPQQFWDGTYKNQLVTPDVYNYKVLCDEDVKEMGKVTVTR